MEQSSNGKLQSISPASNLEFKSKLFAAALISLHPPLTVPVLQFFSRPVVPGAQIDAADSDVKSVQLGDTSLQSLSQICLQC